MRRIAHDLPVPQALLAESKSHLHGGFSPREAWDGFSGKPEVRDRLWPLQKGLCAYCESRLDRCACHVEHIRRKSLHKEETFRWSNLVLNCLNADSCGHFKDGPKKIGCGVSDDPRFIKPTDPDCHRYFYYYKNGEIAPSPDLVSEEERGKAQFTIDALGLMSRRLIRERASILKRFYKQCEAYRDQPESLEFFLRSEFPDSGDSPASFWSARYLHRKNLSQT